MNKPKKVSKKKIKKKTNKSAAKRFKITGTGKIRCRTPGVGHLRSRKSAKRLRRFRKDKGLPEVFDRSIRRMLGLA